MTHPPSSLHRSRARRLVGRVAEHGSRGRWTALLLLALSVGTAAAAVLQAHRATTAHRDTGVRLLDGYAAFAAWSYRQRAAEELRGAFGSNLDPVVHPPPGREHVARVAAAELLATIRDSDTTRSGGAVLGAPYVFRLPLAGAPTFAGELPADHVRHWVADTIRAHARTSPPDREFAIVSGAPEGEERLLVYALVGPVAERVAYGFEVDAARLAPYLGRVLAEEALLPEAVTHGRSGAELLAVRVRSPAGQVLFASGTVDASPRPRVEPFAGTFGGMQVEAAILPSAERSLVGGALVAPRFPLLVGMLLAACGLAVVAVRQLRREGELARLRSDFVSSVSHELRTPLAQVQLFLDTLRAGRFRTNDQREWLLDNMERETARLTALVENVLHFSRAERGAGGTGAAGAREPVALDRYVRRVVAGFAPLATVRGVAFAIDVAPGLTVPLHAESFRQVLLNLLDNAVKYGPAGQTVHITGTYEAGSARLAVEDDGPGVDPRERDRIWEPFRRGAHAVGGVVVGSGIGLAVVHEIVAWHDGRARVERAAGGGARFVVELPGWLDPDVPTPDAAGATAVAAPAAPLQPAS